jgi:hypothetical protein
MNAVPDTWLYGRTGRTIGALLQLAVVTMPLFGYPIVFLMLLPLGLSHLALAGWLLARGLRGPEQAASRVPV